MNHFPYRALIRLSTVVIFSVCASVCVGMHVDVCEGT